VSDQTTPMREQDNIDRLRLARAEGVGPVTYRRVLTRFDTAAAALRSLPRLTRAGAKANPPAVPTEADVIRTWTAPQNPAPGSFSWGMPIIQRCLPGATTPPVIAVQGNAALLAPPCDRAY
jgi:DNA processing protein